MLATLELRNDVPGKGGGEKEVEITRWASVYYLTKYLLEKKSVNVLVHLYPLKPVGRFRDLH